MDYSVDLPSLDGWSVRSEGMRTAALCTHTRSQDIQYHQCKQWEKEQQQQQKQQQQQQELHKRAHHLVAGRLQGHPKGFLQESARHPSTLGDDEKDEDTCPAAPSEGGEEGGEGRGNHTIVRMDKSFLSSSPLTRLDRVSDALTEEDLLPENHPWREYLRGPALAPPAPADETAQPGSSMGMDLRGGGGEAAGGGGEAAGGGAATKFVEATRRLFEACQREYHPDPAVVKACAIAGANTMVRGPSPLYAGRPILYYFMWAGEVECAIACLRYTIWPLDFMARCPHAVSSLPQAPPGVTAGLIGDHFHGDDEREGGRRERGERVLERGGGTLLHAIVLCRSSYDMGDADQTEGESEGSAARRSPLMASHLREEEQKRRVALLHAVIDRVEGSRVRTSHPHDHHHPATAAESRLTTPEAHAKEAAARAAAVAAAANDQLDWSAGPVPMVHDQHSTCLRDYPGLTAVLPSLLPTPPRHPPTASGAILVNSAVAATVLPVQHWPALPARVGGWRGRAAQRQAPPPAPRPPREVTRVEKEMSGKTGASCSSSPPSLPSSSSSQASPSSTGHHLPLSGVPSGAPTASILLSTASTSLSPSPTTTTTMTTTTVNPVRPESGDQRRHIHNGGVTAQLADAVEGKPSSSSCCCRCRRRGPPPSARNPTATAVDPAGERSFLFYVAVTGKLALLWPVLRERVPYFQQQLGKPIPLPVVRMSDWEKLRKLGLQDDFVLLSCQSGASI